MSTKITKSLVVVALFGLLVTGQAFAYKYVMNDSATYSYISATNQVTSLDGGTWDDGYFDYALPGDFEFYFYGRKVTHLRVSTNGYITFGFGSAAGTGVAYENTAIPDGLKPDAIGAVLWDDWYITGTGGMYYEMLGTAPNRSLVIEWRDISSFTLQTEAYEFEAIIYEGSNNILYQYADVFEDAGHDLGQKGTVGVEHPTSLQAEQYLYNSSDLSNGQAILFTPFVHVYGSTDFDGDGTPNATLFRPSISHWFVRGMDGWSTTPAIGDIPVPGDYDGDGIAYGAIFNPSTSTWHTEIGNIVFGAEGDIPVPADYDGDGYTDIATWRPSEGRWYIYGPMGGVVWGTLGDIPFPADLDGDGAAEFVVWRPSDGQWYVYGPMGGVIWGTAGDIPVSADLDGDGAAEFVVWRPSDGQWYVWGPLGGWIWGMDGDIPVPADLDGDGITEAVVWRPSDSQWYVRGPLGGWIWGTLGDIPMMK
jgi:hypothetical protein